MFVTLLIGGCPKRQTGPRVVYVQAPPPAASPAAQPSSQASNAASGSEGAWVIEEPAPPPPPPVETEAPPPAPVPAPVVRRPRRARPEAQEADEAPTVDPNQPANAGETPQLEPRSSPTSRDELRARHVTLEQRIKSIEHTRSFTAVDRRTLEDARGFLFESERALSGGDVLRAEQLAQKASLLLAALEQR